MRRIITALLVAAALLAASPAAAVFEDLAPSPRARAMGGAGVAVADDAFAPYYNPAGLSGLPGKALGISYLRPYGLDFADLFFGTAAIPAGRFGTFGLGVRRFGVEWEQDEIFGDPGEVDLLKETTLTLAHGLPLYQDLHTVVRAGWALNAYRLEFGPALAPLEATGTDDLGDDLVFGLDAGLLVTLHERTRLGVLATSINNPQIGLDDEAIPQRLHGGIAYEPYLGVVTTFEVASVLDQKAQYHGGIEFTPAEGLALRLGAVSNPSKVTAGFGFSRRGLGVDYGFSTGGGTLEASHQFGLRYAWGGEGQ